MPTFTKQAIAGTSPVISRLGRGPGEAGDTAKETRKGGEGGGCVGHAAFALRV